MKRILSCTDGSKFTRANYEYCAWLAQRTGAAVEVLHVTDLRKLKAVSSADLSGQIAIDAYPNLLQQIVELEEKKTKLDHERALMLLEDARGFLKGLGVETVDIRHRTGFLVDEFHELEQGVDLVVLGRRGETADFAAVHLGANVERLVRASHRPCLVTPETFQPIARVLLAYDGGASAQKALDFLVGQPALRDLDVRVLSVGKHGDDPLAESWLKEAMTALDRAGFQTTAVQKAGDPVIALEDYAIQHDIHLVVMGAYGHNRLRRLLVGSATAHVLRSLQVPVMLFR